MDIDNIKTQLKAKGISIRRIARDLNASHATVKKVIEHSYKGTDHRKRTIIEYINNLLSDREDLNTLIYDNIDIILCAFTIALKSPKVKSDSLDRIIPLYQKFSEIKKRNDKNEKKN